MGLKSWLGLEPERSLPLNFQDWLSYFTYNNNNYPLLAPNYTYGSGKQEEPGNSFVGYAEGLYKQNGVIFACMRVREALFSEARFQFRRLESGRPGELFGSQALAPLEQPWPGATTGDLLARAIQDADIAGNFYGVLRPGGRIRRLRPDWVTIILGSEYEGEGWDVDSDVLGYAYQPGGPGSGNDPVLFRSEEVAHFAPIPDPCRQYIGMSWLTPVIREVMGDNAARDHKLAYFENAATPNLIIQMDTDTTQAQYDRIVEALRAKNEGLANAYRTLAFVGGGNIIPVGNDLQQMDFKVTQGAGETRIAAAAGVPATIVGLSEGLQGSSLNAGNYGQSRRLLADKTMSELWRKFAGAMSNIIDVPAGAELWYDDRDIRFLREDVKDQAEISAQEAQTMRTLVDGGFTPESVKEAVIAGDWNRLVHTGLFSVQLQPPGTVAAPETPPTNGAPPKRHLAAIDELISELERKTQ